MSPSKLCRLCVSEQNDVLNIFSLFYGSIPASTFIMDILQIKVDSDTNSGVVMCNGCNISLSNFYEFYKMVRDAQHKYDELIKVQDETNCGILRLIDVEPGTTCIGDEYMKEEYLDIVDDYYENQTEYLDEQKDESILTHQNDAVVDEKTYPLLVTFVPKPEQECKVKSKTSRSRKRKKLKETVTPKSELIKRSKNATTAMFEKYKLEDIFSHGKWKLSPEEKDKIFKLFIDMKCKECDADFSSYCELDEHCITIHEKSALVTCENLTLASYEHVERHILYKHILKSHAPRVKIKIPCKVCNKMVTNSNMKDHLSRHLPDSEREFQCDQCNAGFGLKANLNSHILHRHSTVEVSCDECGKIFKSKQSCAIHKRKVHINFYLCPDCGKEFKSNSNYKIHVNKHRGIVEKVKCEICDTVVKKNSFTGHMKLHNRKEHMKQCPHCSYTGLSITDHVRRVHEKLRPYACTFCEKTFGILQHMREHISAIHSGIPGYTCEVCSKTFMSSGNYRKHLNNSHPREAAEKKMARKNKTTNIPVSPTPKKKKNLLLKP